MEDLLKVGIITRPHGVRGEVKVYPTTDDINRFKKLKEVILKPLSGDEMTLNVVSAKFFKDTVILKFKEFDNLNDVEHLHKSELFVTRENAVKLEPGEYFIADLIGLKAVSDDGALSGIIEDVLKTGANDVYVIKLDDGRELLLPAIKECILEVNIGSGFVKFHLMDGLL